MDSKNSEKHKFKVNILGVDEGFIKLSNKENSNEFSKILLNQFSSHGRNYSFADSISNENNKNNIITLTNKKILIQVN